MSDMVHNDSQLVMPLLRPSVSYVAECAFASVQGPGCCLYCDFLADLGVTQSPHVRCYGSVVHGEVGTQDRGNRGR